MPLLDAPDQQTFARMLNERVVPALGMPGSYTARGRQFDSVVKYLWAPTRPATISRFGFGASSGITS